MNLMVRRLGILIATALLTALIVAPSAALDLDAAKQNYSTFCVKCHGTSGHGDGPAAATLKTKPRDFNDCARMAKLADDTLFKAIHDGGGAVGLSADMPAWKEGFEENEIRDLVGYVRTFCGKQH